MKPRDPPPTPAEIARAERLAREAAALRENLRKRKSQARAQAHASAAVADTVRPS